ncbi:hypothetical protein IVB41_26890 [Bradyrhizobium sp. 44]|uniref:hypothetical protein n=1 Tax=Bradyrhizobium sp. 44 TaxID=2782675 RepID=UPI001FFBE14F|nr:hypothetical protein [Bradyrhizobium sp. 44]MCK1287537.1 hypothetical protein [Bradyrhizobium sp. 44]
MSLLEQYQKRKEATKPREIAKLTVKDWITTTLSVLAFLVSISTTYFTLVRKEDDFSVFISPAGYVNTANKQLDFSLRTDFAFINTGNRPVSLTDVILMVHQPKLVEGDLEPDCKSGEQSLIPFDVDAFTIKPGEIVPKKYLLPSRSDDEEAKSLRAVVKISEKNLERKEPVFGTCLWISYITADGKSRGRQIPVALTKFEFDKKIYFALPSLLLFKPGDSHTLYRWSNSIF